MGEIPRCVHQIWIGDRGSRPESWMRTWRIDYCKENPAWTYREWDEKAIAGLLGRAQNICPQRRRDMTFKPVLGRRSLPWRQCLAKLAAYYYREPTPHGRADMARLLILYFYGGVYVDADSVWVKGSLDKFIEDGGVFAAREPGKPWLANGVIGASQRNQVIGSLIRRLACTDYNRARSADGPYSVTGPLLLNSERARVRVVPSVCFYPVPWAGIRDNEMHRKLALPDEAVMFQYGMTTNRIRAPVN